MRKRQIIQQIVCLLSLCFLLSACSSTSIVNKEEVDLIKDYSITPVYEVEDYRFVADGNGIIIDWKVTNQEEIDKFGNVSSDFSAANKNYLIRNVYKQRDRYPEPTIKAMEEEEYLYLDVYDLRKTGLPKKRIDLLEVSLTYLKDEGYKVNIAGVYDKVFQRGESNYTMIFVAKNMEFKYLLLNLDTGLVEGEEPYKKNQLTNREYFYLSNEIAKDQYILTSGGGW